MAPRAYSWGPVRALTAPNDEPSLRTFHALIQRLDRVTLALCLLQGALQNVGRIENNYTETALTIGGNIYIECFAAALLRATRRVLPARSKSVSGVGNAFGLAALL